MNNHFEDSLYYFERAVEHAKLGVEETTRPALERVRTRLGREPEPEAGRVEGVVETVKSYEKRAEAEARDALDGARDRFDSYHTKA